MEQKNNKISSIQQWFALKKIFNILCFLYAMERVSIPSFIKKRPLRSSSQMPVAQKPTDIASLVLHEGLPEENIPPHHRLSLHQLYTSLSLSPFSRPPRYSLMQSSIDVILQSILSLRQEDR